jgi:hypothetical protein
MVFLFLIGFHLPSGNLQVDLRSGLLVYEFATFLAEQLIDTPIMDG